MKYLPDVSLKYWSKEFSAATQAPAIIKEKYGRWTHFNIACTVGFTNFGAVIINCFVDDTRSQKK